MDGNITYALEQSVENLENVLFPNNDEASQKLRAKMVEFKEKLMDKMKADLESALENNPIENSDSIFGNQSVEELKEDLRDRWDVTIVKEFNKWKLGTLSKWVDKMKHIWNEIQDSVHQRIVKLKYFLQRHTPFRNACGNSTNIDMMNDEPSKNLSKGDKPGFLNSVVEIIAFAFQIPVVFMISGIFLTIEWIIIQKDDFPFSKHEIKM